MSLGPLVFRKSSFSQINDCVQWAHAADGVHVADTKTPEGPTFHIPHHEWTEFTSAVLAGEAGTGPLTYTADPTGTSVFMAPNPNLALRFNNSEWTAFELAIAAGEVHQRHAS